MITNSFPQMRGEHSNSWGNQNPPSFLFHLLLSLVYLSLLAFTPGCARKPVPKVTLVPIEGKVTLNGQPLDNALIRFQPLDKTLGPAGVSPVKQGTYSLDQKHGVPIGELRVEISDLPPADGEPPPGERLAPKPPAIVPERYQTDSQLIVKTVPGPNKQDFKLTAP
ncbi:MAG: hypothetical protein U0903_09650 [Planctomycetales bacterium]